MSLDSYLQMFVRLRRAPNRIFSDLTKCKAPHKAARQIGTDPNVPGILQTLPGRNLLSPSEK